jgi:ABC-type multidrug transport system ATPase subunit
VLEQISLFVPHASCMALLGKNGAGKTTLLKVIAGLASFQSGEVQLCGSITPAQLRQARRMHLSYSGGERGFYFRLSVRHNLEFFGRLEGLRYGTLRARVAEVLEILGLGPQQNQRFAELSSGQRQRVAIAQALLKRPDVLLLDEPTRLLDPLYAHELRRFIKDQLVTRDGKTVLIATNAVDEAIALGDAFAIIHDGRIKPVAEADGTAVTEATIAAAFESIRA